MSDSAVYVRYVYLTPKCLAILEALDKALEGIDLSKFKEDQELPPLPSAKWFEKNYPGWSDEKPVETRRDSRETET